jgi:hypothetical protein
MRLARAQGQRDVVENAAVNVAQPRLFRCSAAGRAGRSVSRKAKLEGRIDVGGGDRFHALQHLDPALRLAGLGGLGAEAVR